jgi:hypothetical protein
VREGFKRKLFHKTTVCIVNPLWTFQLLKGLTDPFKGN